MNAVPKIAAIVSLAASIAAAGSAPIVTSINGVSGNVTLAAGSNVTITPSGKTLTISSGAPAVAHDASLSGNGTPASPLGIASGQTVRSINGSTDAVTIAAGPGVKIQTTGGTVIVSAARRRFYVTGSAHTGAEAAGACDDGFHMANMWEIFDLGTMKYDATRGFTEEDDGPGGTPIASGWIRTGRFANAAGSEFGPGGAANCNLWQSAASTDFGTIVGLNSNWGAQILQQGVSEFNAVSPWEAFATSCAGIHRVWCVEDDPDQ